MHRVAAEEGRRPFPPYLEALRRDRSRTENDNRRMEYILSNSSVRQSRPVVRVEVCRLRSSSTFDRPLILFRYSSGFRLRINW